MMHSKKETLMTGFRAWIVWSAFILLALSSVSLSAQELEAPVDVEIEEIPEIAETSALHVVGVSPLPFETVEDRVVLFFDDMLDVSETGASPLMIHPKLSDLKMNIDKNYIWLSSSDMQKHDSFIIELHEKLKSVEGCYIAPEQRRFGFSPFLFQPRRLFLVEESDTRTKLGLTFALKLDKEPLSRHLSLMDTRGEAIPFSLDSREDGKIWTVEFNNPAQWPVTLMFQPGLQDRTGLFTLSTTCEYTYPQDLDLAVQDISWDNIRANQQLISLRFNKPVTIENLTNNLVITRKDTKRTIPFTLHAREDNLTIAARITQDISVPLSVNVTVRAGLPGAEKSVLPADYSSTLEHSPPLLRVTDTSTNDWDIEAGLRVVIRFSEEVDVQDFIQHATFEPPLPNMQVESWWGNAVSVSGDWRSRTRYTIRLKAGMKYGDSYRLKEDLTTQAMTGTISTYAGFSGKDTFYFPRRASAPLQIRTRNTDKVTLSLYRMFPSNITTAVQDMYDGNPGYQFDSRFCELLATIELPINGPPDAVHETPVPLDSLFLTSVRGVFCITVEADTTWRGRDSRLVVWTDIGTLAHWQNDQLAVFAHDLSSLSPTPDAKVTVWSNKNQILGETVTNTQGMALLGGFRESAGYPSAVVVETDQDYAFLELSAREDDVAFSVGMPPFDRDGYDAFIYADRELYRPGETAHLHWLVRTNYGDALGEVPLLVRVRRPNGTTLLEQPVTLSSMGTGGLDLSTDRSYPTGKYAAQILIPGSMKPIGVYEFRLEDFVPNRIRVDTHIVEPHLFTGTPFKAQVDGQYLFGAPAADRVASLDLVINRADFAPDGWKAFYFGNDSEFTADVISFGETRTDADGKAEFDVEYTGEATFPLNATIVGKVRELGGRSVSGFTQRLMFPSSYLLGIAVTPESRGMTVDVAAVHPDGDAAMLDAVEVVVEKLAWNYYVRQYYDRHEPGWSEYFEEVERHPVTLDEGRGSIQITPADYGSYRVSVRSGQTEQYSSLTFYWWGSGGYVDRTVRPSLIRLSLDKETYDVGETAQLTLESPFDGKGFVVLQSDDIQRMYAIDVTDGSATLNVSVTSEQFPCAWLEATVVHAFEQGRAQVYPFSSFAMTQLSVRNPNRVLEVSFPDLPEEVRPAGQATFVVETHTVDGTPTPAEVTVAAVDEGIHLITNYRSPNPLNWLMRPRRPDYRRAHYYDRVAYDFDKPAPGGDLDALLGQRRTPPDDNWIKPLALWTGVVHTDEDGRAEVTFDLPEFAGQIRLDAVACTDAALGSNSANVYVRRVCMLQTSMPRFMLPGDSAVCRAVMFNHTDTPLSVELRYEVSGTLSSGSGSQNLHIDPKGEVSAVAQIVSGNRVGQGAIKWEAIFRDESETIVEHITQDAPMPVRAPAVYQSHHDFVTLEPGESRTFTNTRFLEDERTQVEMTVAGNPLLRLVAPLRFLIGYPYGCLEQTASRLFPMYLLRRHASLFDVSPDEDDPYQLSAFDADSLEVFLQNGVDKLFAMQTAEGGLAFWSGGSTPNPYASVYAMHFLALMHRDRQFNLPEENYNALKEYIWSVATDWTDDAAGSLYTRAYAMYTLALDGDGRVLQHISRFDDIPLTRAARLLLAAAVALSGGDELRIQMYMRAPITPDEPYQRDSTLASAVRNKAVQLLAMLQANGDEGTINTVAEELIAYLDSGQAVNTQESAFIIAALAEYLLRFEEQVDQSKASITGPEGESTIAARQIFRETHRGPDGVYTVTNTGSVPVYVNLTTRGIPETPHLGTIEKGVKVRRMLFSRAGNRISDEDIGTFQHGESYVVGLELQTETPRQHLVAVDMLPAGLEIENPRLHQEALPGAQFKDAVSPTHLDVRDDRLILAFDELPKGKSTYYYVVRAVTPGKFMWPAFEAECMYDARVQGATAVLEAEVR